jgi:hypothetical protein
MDTELMETDRHLTVRNRRTAYVGRFDMLPDARDDQQERGKSGMRENRLDTSLVQTLTQIYAFREFCQKENLKKRMGPLFFNLDMLEKKEDGRSSAAHF